jgi:hypothetical protein
MPLATYPPDRANLYRAKALVYLDTVALERRETGGLLKVICPTGQAELSATDWRDGQKVHRVVEASISEIGCDDDGVMVFAGNARV